MTSAASSTTASPQQPDFDEAIRRLKDSKAQHLAGRLDPISYRDARESALCTAVSAMAADFGVRLEPLQVDSNGELRLVALHPDGRRSTMGCGQFGQLAEVLNGYRPRTGIIPGKVDPANGWCMVNHFEAEQMVLDRHESLEADRNDQRERANRQKA